jgi:hypothetical protein
MPLTAMGGSFSKPTVLDCMLKHFKKGFSGDYGIKMPPRELHMLCELEWPTFGVNWPPEGTLELLTVRAIYQVIIRTPRFQDQFPYVDFWLQVAQTMPHWVPFCANKKIMKLKDQKLTKHVLQGDPEDEPPVCLLYIPSMPPPSEKPVPPLPDSLPPSVSPPQSCHQPPSPNDVSHPSLSWSPSPQPLSHLVHSSQAPATQARALKCCSIRCKDPSRLVLIVWSNLDALSSITSLSVTDLLNWRNHTLPYSEKLQAMSNLLESIFQTHQSACNECQQTLLTFFNTEEQ